MFLSQYTKVFIPTAGVLSFYSVFTPYFIFTKNPCNLLIMWWILLVWFVLSSNIYLLLLIYTYITSSLRSGLETTKPVA